MNCFSLVLLVFSKFSLLNVCCKQKRQHSFFKKGGKKAEVIFPAKGNGQNAVSDHQRKRTRLRIKREGKLFLSNK